MAHLAKEHGLGNPLKVVGWLSEGEEVPHWVPPILAWLTKYNAIMGDSSSKTHSVFQDQVQKALKARKPQLISTIYESWAKSLGV